MQGVLDTLKFLSYSGLMDWTFETDSLGNLRHHVLISLRSTVGVFPTVSFQGALGPHSLIGPAPSVEIYNYLTQSLCPIAGASIQAPKPPLEVLGCHEVDPDISE